nr:unnamed protein product [Callosobruchus chinensis]
MNTLDCFRKEYSNPPTA